MSDINVIKLGTNLLMDNFLIVKIYFFEFRIFFIWAIIVSPPITVCPSITFIGEVSGKYKSTRLPNLIIPKRSQTLTF